MAPKKDMMAVLEYWYGYLFPMFDCKRNQEDHDRVPKTRAIEPSIHLSVFLDELSLVMALSTAACEWMLVSNKGTPLSSSKITPPPMHINVPIILALPLVHLMFTASNLRKLLSPHPYYQSSVAHMLIIMFLLWYLLTILTQMVRPLGMW